MLSKREIERFEENRTKNYLRALDIIYNSQKILGLSDEICERACDILEKEIFKDITKMEEIPYKNRQPKTLASAAIYLATVEYGDAIPQKKIGKVTGASENAISTSFNEMATSQGVF